MNTIYMAKILTIIAMLLLVVACSKVSIEPILSKNTISGSSEFKFKPSYLIPVSYTIIATGVKEDFTPSKLIPVDTTTEETPPNDNPDIPVLQQTLNPELEIELCDKYKSIFTEKIPATWLADNPNSVDGKTIRKRDGFARSSAFVAEKGYVELVKNYCYAKTTYYLHQTEIVGNSKSLYEADTKIWLRNAMVEFAPGRSFDYYMSQSTENDTQIIGKFKEVSTSGTERLNGILLYKEKSKDEKEILLIRYFFQDTTDDAIADNFRWEGYAMKTRIHTVNGQERAVHYIASHLVDYEKNRPDLTDDQGDYIDYSLSNRGPSRDNDSYDLNNDLVIQQGLYAVYEEFGTKEIRAEYCYHTPTEIEFICPDFSSFDILKKQKFEQSSQVHYYRYDGNDIIKNRDNTYASTYLYLVDALRELDNPNVISHAARDAILQQLSPDGSGLFTPRDLLAIDNNDVEKYFDFPKYNPN